MKKIALLLAGVVLFFSSCDEIASRTIKGNGNIVKETRSVTKANKIEIAGSFIVELTPSATTTVEVEGDDNLIGHVITKMRGDVLVIRPEEDTRLRTDHKIYIRIGTDMLDELDITGNSTVTGKGKFTGSNKMEVDLSGNGTITLDVNTPSIEADISGSGNIILSGETKDLTAQITGSGDIRASELKAETADVSITGSGNVHVFAGNKISADITGSGDVFYKGNPPTVDANTTGSGKVKKEE